MSLFATRATYKPLQYPWAYEAWHNQQKMHWLPEEVPMADDVLDWRSKLTDAERHLLTQIFRFFVQSDVEVSRSYHTIYLNWFKPTEIQMMLNAFNNMETVHIAAYAHLLDTIGMPESEYEAFLKYREMKEKWEYLQGFYNPQSKEDLALSMAVFGAFTEGLQLFASFAMLLNFPRYNKMKGMGQVITWSVRDESLHCANIIQLFHTLLEEEPNLNTPQLRARIEQACRDVVEHEDAFIDLAFGMGSVEGMTAADVKRYIRYIADRRMIQLGYKGIFRVKDNPIPWLDEMLNAVEHTNFFEQRATEYAKASTRGTWEEVWAALDEPKHRMFTVYTKAGCPNCEAAKRLIDVKGHKYKVVDLTDNEFGRQLLYREHNMRQMPVIFEGGTLVGGFEQLRASLSTPRLSD